MAFSGSTFNLVSGNPVSAGTTISPTWANDTLQDIAANGLSQVILRSGIAPFTGEVLIIDGTASVPGIGFNSEAATGIYKSAAGTIAFACEAANVVNISANGLTLSVGTFNNSITDDISAAGSNQGTATALTTSINNVTTVGVVGEGVVLPTGSSGMELVVINSSAYALLIYPAGSAEIDGNGASTAITLGAGGSWSGVADSSANWHTVGTNVIGTANEVIVTPASGSGTITLSLPQAINTTAAVRFGTLGLGIAPTSAPITFPNSSTIGGSVTSYGSLTIGGASAGYAGIQFTGVSGYNTLMTNGTTCGMYNQSSSAWQWEISSGTITGVTACAGAWTSGGVVTGTGFNTSSDIELKTNVQQITDHRQILSGLIGTRFDWKADGAKSAGLIAQNVEKVMPELVSVNEKSGHKTVNYNGIIGVLVEAVKDLIDKNQSLTQRLDAIGEKVALTVK